MSVCLCACSHVSKTKLHKICVRVIGVVAQSLGNIDICCILSGFVDAVTFFT